MFKKLFNKQENKGYVSIEVIIIAAIILSLFSFFFLRWKRTADDLSTSTIIGMEEQVNEIKDPKSGESFLDLEDYSDTLLSGGKGKSQSFKFESSLNKEQTLTLTIDNLNQLKNITASNGGTVEVVSTNGNEVTIRVAGGTPSESIVIAGEYIPYDEKVITNYDSENYNDGTYSGTLSMYVHSGQASKTTSMTETKTYKNLNEILNETTYNVAGYNGTLSKDGEPEAILVSGTPSSTKEITQTAKNNNNVFVNTIAYDEGEFSGTLTKSGSVTSKLISGYESSSKTVTGQSNANYSDGDGYTGTLTQYVVSGQASESKTVTETKTQSTNNFETTLNYNKDGYKGTLSKSGIVTSKIVGGTADGSKSVSNQKTASYSDSQGYTGTLTVYDNTKISNLSAGSKVYFDNSYWTVLNPSEGLVMRDVKRTLLYFDATSRENQSNVFDVTKPLNIGYYLNTTYYNSLTAEEKSFIQSKTWNIGHEFDETSTKINANVGLLTKSEYEQHRYKNYLDFSADNYTWLITPSSYNKKISWSVRSTGIVEANWDTFNEFAVRPVVSLKNDLYIDENKKVTTDKVAYKGVVSKPDTRVYEYSQTYTGTVATEDTREYAYQGTVSRPDTRIFEYTQVYQGTVTKPDTRTYEYKQTYSGEVKTPDTRIYKYQGMVVRPESDTREYEHYYQYDINVNYFEKQ